MTTVPIEYSDTGPGPSHFGYRTGLSSTIQPDLDMVNQAFFSEEAKDVKHYNVNQDTDIMDFLGLHYVGAEETVDDTVTAKETSVAQESLMECGVGWTYNLDMKVPGIMGTDTVNAPVISVREKFTDPFKAPEIVTQQKRFIKQLAPRQGNTPLTIVHPQPLKCEPESGHVTPTSQQTFTQQLERAGQLLQGIGIQIRQGGPDSNLGIIHLRSASKEQNLETDVNKEKEIDPENKFKVNEIVYATDSALTDLVKYCDTPLLNSGVHGVYTNKKFRFLEQSTKVPEESFGAKFLKQLGKGSFGTVELWCSQNQQYVKKKIEKNFWPNEVLLTSTLKHPSILKTHGFIMNQGVPEIIMNYAGESLLAYSLRKDRPEDIVWEVTYYALEGLKYLHENGIIHFDMKPENLCIKEGPCGLEVTITDFGSAQKVGESTVTKYTTVEYSSPELCQHQIHERLPDLRKYLPIGSGEKPITGKTDVFSLALAIMFPYEKAHVLVKYVTGGQSTYTSSDSLQDLRIKLTLQLALSPGLVQDLIPHNVGQNMRDVILSLIQPNPDERFHANQAIDLMKNISKQAELSREQNRIQLKKQQVRCRVSRKVIQPRRPSTETKSPKPVGLGERRASHVGVDMSRVTQPSEAILQENSQFKARVVKGLLKRKLNVPSTPSVGKHIKIEMETESENLPVLIKTETVENNMVDFSSSCNNLACNNMPNLGMLC